MNIELYIDGQLADLDKKDFAYNLQVNNMFDFDTRQVSYSDVLYLPTTATNRKIFDLADIPASDNRGAYKRYTVDLYVNGVAIALRANGFLTGKRGDRFIFDFKDNSKDIYQLMVGKKLKDLPLEELKHEKNLTTINSFNFESGNKGIIYAVADYGGETIKKIDGTDYYNFDYCPPSIKMDWILQKIKELNPENPYIFKSNFFDSQFWKSLYMTVSEAKTIFDKNSLTEVFKRENWMNTGTFNGGGSVMDRYQEIGFSDDGRMRDVRNPNTHKFSIADDGKYKIDFNFKQVIFLSNYFTFEFKLWFGLKVNDNVVWEDEYYSRESGTKSIVQGKQHSNILDLKKGDKVYFFVRKRTDVNTSDAMYRIWFDGETLFSINKVKNIDINEQLSDLSLIDWFKEVLNLFSLTPMKDDKTNNIQQFYTLSERVNEAPVLDWSDKFISITEEKYHDTSAYGQVNKFKYSKYDEQNNQQDSNDFDLIFNDPAIIFQKEFKSKFFLGIPFSSELKVGGEKLDTLLFFNKEVKEKGGVTDIEYKAQNNRFHIFKMVLGGLTINGCLNDGAEKGLATPLVAESQSLRWENLLKNYHSDLPRLMENLHFVVCEFNLSELDVHNFSFFSRIYVEQFGHYFLPNKIVYRPEKPTVVEMIKIRPMNNTLNP